MLYVLYMRFAERPRRSHKSFLHTQKLYETETFLNASVNQKNAIKWNENRNKQRENEGEKKNRGISCWIFCELWQKSEMTQSVCPTSAINPLWNQL